MKVESQSTIHHNETKRNETTLSLQHGIRTGLGEEEFHGFEGWLFTDTSVFGQQEERVALFGFYFSNRRVPALTTQIYLYVLCGQ